MAVWSGSQFIISPDEQNGVYISSGYNEELFLLKENNLSDLPNKQVARQNLGIYTSTQQPIKKDINDIWIDLSD